MSIILQYMQHTHVYIYISVYIPKIHLIYRHISENLLSTLTSRDIWSVSAAACITQPEKRGGQRPQGPQSAKIWRCRPLNHVFLAQWEIAMLFTKLDRLHV